MMENINNTILNFDNIIKNYINKDNYNSLNHRELSEYIIKSIKTTINNENKKICYHFMIAKDVNIAVELNEFHKKSFYISNDLVDELPLIIINIENLPVFSQQKYSLAISIKDNKFYLYNWKYVNDTSNIESVNEFYKDNEILTDNFLDIIAISSNFIYNSLEEAKKEFKNVANDFDKIINKRRLI